MLVVPHNYRLTLMFYFVQRNELGLPWTITSTSSSMLPVPEGLKINRYFPWSELFTARIVSDARESVTPPVNRSWYLGSTLKLPDSSRAIRSPLPLPVIFTNWANAAEPSRVYSHTRVKSRVSIANDRSEGDAVNFVSAASRQNINEQINNQWQ